MPDQSVEIRFYHLEETSVADDLPPLVSRMIDAGGRALVLVSDEAKAKAIDKALWAFDPLSFLPHGIDKGDADAVSQPVLISTSGQNRNQARFLAMVDGTRLSDPSQFDRAFYMFDSRDQALLAKARSDWVDFKKQGFELSYWQKSAATWSRKN